jgi:hypothetical protein
MNYPIYNNYEEIPRLVADYILEVANERNLAAIPLENINVFLDTLNEAEKERLLYFPKRNFY